MCYTGVVIRTIEDILGWERQSDINYATGEEVTFWLPPVPRPDSSNLYPRPTVDDMLTWMHINCPTYWQFGGIPYHYWVQVGHGLTPQIKEQETLLDALTAAVRYVDEFKEDLH